MTSSHVARRIAPIQWYPAVSLEISVYRTVYASIQGLSEIQAHSTQPVAVIPILLRASVLDDVVCTVIIHLNSFQFFNFGIRFNILAQPELEKVPDIVYAGWAGDPFQWKCCGSKEGGSQPNCDLAPNDPFAAPLVSNLETYWTAGVTPRPTASATQTPGLNSSTLAAASHHGLSEGAKVGIGVGIGVGVPILMILSFAAGFFMRRRITKQIQQAQPTQVVEKVILKECPAHGAGQSDMSPSELYSNDARHELPGN